MTCNLQSLQNNDPDTLSGPGQLDAADEGFALLVVIWAMGLVSLVTFTMVAATHYRLKAASNIVEGAKAANLAEAASILAKIELLRQLEEPPENGPNVQKFTIGSTRPTFCTMPDGAAAAILIEDERGKINLNFAPPEAIALLIRGFGISIEEATRLARNIRRFTTVLPENADDSIQAEAGINPGDKFGSKHAPFDTTLELDQVNGITHSLFEALLPFLTVASHQSSVDQRFAPPALLAALEGAPPKVVSDLARKPRSISEIPGRSAGLSIGRQPFENETLSAGHAFLIGAEIVTLGGGYFAREVIAEWHSADRSLRTKEWRRGRGRFGYVLRDQVEKLHTGQASAWADC